MRRYITSAGLCLALLIWSGSVLAQEPQAQAQRAPWWAAALPTLSLEYQRQLRPALGIAHQGARAQLSEPSWRTAGSWAVLLSWQLYPIVGAIEEATP